MIIKLPSPNFKSNISLEETIKKRRSIRKFKPYKISLEEISQLLWAAYGVSDEKSGFRTVPSAGATYPLEVYYLTEEGVFHYLPYNHSAESVIQKDVRNLIVEASLGQRFIMEAAIDILLCAVYERTTLCYGERGYRYVYMEVGHSAQNISLQAISLGLDSVCIGAFYDEKLREILLLPIDVHPLYIVAIGKRS
ncbi:MAG: SagB/ThcOx family dehydrogenase [Elusimicrobiota bacterium]|nr:SagB/ThcOx family dehydrogenase [Endomicrobiia bacterium]MDW8165239.1 SagB/ThcOx family dehydrogenase [Elusimicrobiota bacterium]